MIILQFKRIVNENKRQKDVVKLFAKLYIPPTHQSPKLHESEIFEDESFRENTEKEIWKLFQTKSFKYIKGKFYDDFETNIGERLIQCSTICLLNDEVPMDDNWYEVDFDINKIALLNNNNTIFFNFSEKNQNAIITSANKMLLDNNSQILIDALLQLKNIFYFTDIVFDYVENEFVISDLGIILNAFSNKPFSQATIKRRFAHKMEKTDKENVDNPFRPSSIYKKL